MTSSVRFLIGALLVPSFLAAAQEGAPLVVQQTLLQKLNMPTIYILVACSMLIVWLVTEGYLRTALSQVVPGPVVEALRVRFRAGEYHEAYAYCRTQPVLLARVVGHGLRHAPEGKTAAEDAMMSALAGGNAGFQNKIAYLSVIGVIAPMIGLAGTVFGMIEAFAAMGQAGAADPSKLSGAIGKVLYATAGGLVVAIPAFVFYYLLRNRTAHAIHAAQEAASDLFRQFPFDDLRDTTFEGSEPCAARPKWLTVADDKPAEAAEART